MERGFIYGNEVTCSENRNGSNDDVSSHDRHCIYKSSYSGNAGLCTPWRFHGVSFGADPWVEYGAVASAFGGLLADVLGGAAAWAPWTFVIKGVMAVILGLIAMKLSERSSISRGRFIFGEAAGMVVAGIFMVAGYYLAEGVMYGNWLAPVIGIPWNIGQFVVGMVIAIVLATALCKTPARSFFTYSIRTE